MNQKNQLRLNKITLDLAKGLSNSKRISGTILGSSFNQTRGAINQKVSNLNQLGLKVNSKVRSGYQLINNFYALSETKIRKELSQDTLATIKDIAVLREIDSTNNYSQNLLATSSNNNLVVCEWQYLGKGRMQRKWVSSLGGSICMSIGLKDQIFTSESGIEGVSLVCGLALSEVMEEYGIKDIKLKWPNDILVQKTKIAGILINFKGNVYDSNSFIIGIGINYNLNQDYMQKHLDSDWTDMVKENNDLAKVDRNIIIAKMTNKIIKYVNNFKANGLSKFKKAWEKQNIHQNKSILLNIGNDKLFKGICCGINDRGQLMIKDAKNNINCYSYGEVSLKSNYK